MYLQRYKVDFYKAKSKPVRYCKKFLCHWGVIAFHCKGSFDIFKFMGELLLSIYKNWYDMYLDA